VDWPSAFTVLAHELRSPAQVISGYTRMLSEGRLEDGQRQRVFNQLESAAGRISLISRQASELAYWQSRPPRVAHGVPLADLVTSASAGSTSPDRISARLSPAAGVMRVRALDDAALSTALATILEMASRDVTDDTILVVSRASGSEDTCDVLIGAGKVLSPAELTPEADGTFSIERGGFGLAMVLAVAVLEAHGATLWNVRGRTGIVGITLRIEPSQTEP
jgi:hypothetical protein